MREARFEGRVALVTGGASGIGRATALRLAEEGASVVVTDLQDEAGEAVAAEIREGDGEALFVGHDVSDQASWERALGAAGEAFGRLDVLVNNAGVQTPSPSHETEMDAFDWVLNVNLRGSFLCARAAIAHFVERGGGGVVLNNSSVHEIIPKPGYASYSISKGGMENMTRTLALEYADRGIRVNAVGPGAIVTPINEAWIDHPEKRAAVESRIPMGRAGAPEEIAAVFAFLASNEASYITGQTIFACGGLTLFPEYRSNWAS
jgi:glucose 1-dehydrogenase